MMRTLGRDVAVMAVITGGSALGDVAAQVAMVLRVHQGGGSVWAVTMLLLAGILPAVVLARLAGVLADRYDSRMLMVGCALAQALVCLPLAASPSVGVMVGLAAGLGTLAAIAGPARNALGPDMVEPSDLLRATAVLRGASAAGRMAGWPLGGFLTGMLGTGSVLLLDAVSFAILAAGAMLIRTRRLPGPASGPRLRGETRGWIGRRVDPPLLLMAGSVGLVLLFVSTTNVAQVFFVKDVLGASDVGYGMVGACWMIGMVLAVPIMAPGRCTRGALAATVVASEAATGVAVLGAGLSPSPAMVAVWYLLGGLASSAMMISGAALVQLVAPREVRGRVLGGYAAMVNAAIAVALGLSGGLLSLLGARCVFLVAGTLAIAASAISAGLLRVLPRRAGRGSGPMIAPLMEGKVPVSNVGGPD